MKARQILECIDIHRRVDDCGRDANDEHKKKEKASREFTHAYALPSLLLG